MLSRHGRADEDGIRYLTGDLASGQGIEPAVDGVETVVHLAGSNRGDEAKARNLVRGGRPMSMTSTMCVPSHPLWPCTPPMAIGSIRVASTVT